MSVLKGLALGLLSFLLFLSLAVFGLVFTLNSTLLNPEFIANQVNKLDLSATTREIAGEQISGQLPPEAVFLEEAVYTAIDNYEPLIKEQVNNATHDFYDFLLGKSERLTITVSLEPLRENLEEDLKQTFLQNLPPETAGLPPEMIDSYFNQYYQQFAMLIPLEFELDESLIPPDVMTQLTQARQYISYAQTVYYALIGFMVLLIALIILIHRDVRKSTRDLGITLLLYGAIEFAGVFLARNFMPSGLPLHQIPSSLQTWVLGLTSDLLAPLQTFSIGVMAAGVVLLVVSFVYKPRAAEE